jgi:D-alanyl-D-alanine carboxypeptidase
MNHNAEKSAIEVLFRKQVRRDQKVKNAYLLVQSEKTGLHLNLAEGPGENGKPTPQQPVYMASVGKLFTSVIVSILYEQGALSFEDRISRYIDSGLTKGLHVYKGKDHSTEIQIRHLLNQTSGLSDNFYPLLDKLLADHLFDISPREAVEWAKKNLTPQAPPGKKSYYTDTNYHLLGLIVERVCGEPFHAVLKKLIFNALGMKQSYMLHYSEPEKASSHPEAGFYIGQTRLNDFKGFAGLDYAGGGVVAPMEDLLLFMKALTGHRLISKETLETMKNDKARLNPGFDYGYGIWQVRTIPLLMPAKYKSWGVLGATGAFMFYHPELNAYLIGNFNHASWQRKCVRFMFRVMDKLRK